MQISASDPVTSPPERRREILVVSHYYAAHGGGIERAAGRLIEELAGDGGFRFVWAASEGAAGERMPANGKQALLPMRAYGFLERLCGVPWPVWGWRSLFRLRDAVVRADIVWLHDAPYMGSVAAFFMARARHKPIVITQHIGTVPYRNPLRRGLMTLADLLLTRTMLRTAQQAVFVSDAVAESYHRRVGFSAPVKIIPNGVDAGIFRPATAEKRRYLRDGFAIRDDQPVLLFVGRFVEKKGLSAIRHLARALPAWRFWLAGQGPIDPAQWYMPNVHVFRDRTGAALAELYQAADLLILPSYGEGFPLVIQEAMACGLPVMCSLTTAAGSRPAAPYLLTATVNPHAPARTATMWAQRLHAQRPFLPLDGPKSQLAEAAQSFWQWPVIAGHYAEIFRGLGRPPAR